MTAPPRKAYRPLALGLLVLLEVAWGCVFWRVTRPTISQAYLVKNGASYVLLWDEVPGQQPVRKVFARVDDALRFAKSDLSLSEGPNPRSHHPVRALWLRHLPDRTVLYWQTSGLPYLNRLTFRRNYEAYEFATAFQNGAYSFSPDGHSISLVPTR